jgi:hypothetical protein
LYAGSWRTRGLLAKKRNASGFTVVAPVMNVKIKNLRNTASFLAAVAAA